MAPVYKAPNLEETLTNKRFFLLTDRWHQTLNWCSDQVFAKFEGALEKKWGPVTEMTFYKDTTFTLWTIDAYARKLFPFVFLILQISYWTSYLYLM